MLLVLICSINFSAAVTDDRVDDGMLDLAGVRQASRYRDNMASGLTVPAAGAAPLISSYGAADDRSRTVLTFHAECGSSQCDAVLLDVLVLGGRMPRQHNTFWGLWRDDVNLGVGCPGCGSLSRTNLSPAHGGMSLRTKPSSRGQLAIGDSDDKAPGRRGMAVGTHDTLPARLGTTRATACGVQLRRADDVAWRNGCRRRTRRYLELIRGDGVDSWGSVHVAGGGRGCRRLQKHPLCDALLAERGCSSGIESDMAPPHHGLRGGGMASPYFLVLARAASCGVQLERTNDVAWRDGCWTRTRHCLELIGGERTRERDGVPCAGGGRGCLRPQMHPLFDSLLTERGCSSGLGPTAPPPCLSVWPCPADCALPVASHPSKSRSGRGCIGGDYMQHCARGASMYVGDIFGGTAGNPDEQISVRIFCRGSTGGTMGTHRRPGVYDCGVLHLSRNCADDGEMNSNDLLPPLGVRRTLKFVDCAGELPTDPHAVTQPWCRTEDVARTDSDVVTVEVSELASSNPRVEVRRSGRPRSSWGQRPALQRYLILDAPLAGGGCRCRLRGPVAWPHCCAAPAMGGADTSSAVRTDDGTDGRRAHLVRGDVLTGLQRHPVDGGPLVAARRRRRKRSRADSPTTGSRGCDCGLTRAVTEKSTWTSCFPTCLCSSRAWRRGGPAYRGRADATHAAAGSHPDASGCIASHILDTMPGNHLWEAGGAATRFTHEVVALGDGLICSHLGADDDEEEEEHRGDTARANQGPGLDAATNLRYAGRRGNTADGRRSVGHGRCRGATLHHNDAGETDIVSHDGPVDHDSVGHVSYAFPAAPRRHGQQPLSCRGRAVSSPWPPGGAWRIDHSAKWSSSKPCGLDTGEAASSPVHRTGECRGRREEAEGSTSLRQEDGRRSYDDDDKEATPRYHTDDVGGHRGTTNDGPEDDELEYRYHRTAAGERREVGTMRRWVRGEDGSNWTTARRPTAIDIRHHHCDRIVDAADESPPHHLCPTIHVEGRRAAGLVGGPRSGQGSSVSRSHVQCRAPSVGRDRSSSNAVHIHMVSCNGCVWGWIGGAGAAAGQRRAATALPVPGGRSLCVKPCTSPGVGQVLGASFLRSGAHGDGGGERGRRITYTPDHHGVGYRAIVPGMYWFPDAADASDRAFFPDLAAPRYAADDIIATGIVIVNNIYTWLPRAATTSRGWGAIYWILIAAAVIGHTRGRKVSGRRCARPALKLSGRRHRHVLAAPHLGADSIRTSAKAGHADRRRWRRRNQMCADVATIRPGQRRHADPPWTYSHRHHALDADDPVVTDATCRSGCGAAETDSRGPARHGTWCYARSARRRRALGTVIMCIIAYLILFPLADNGGRIGEADNPGPLSAFDDPEADLDATLDDGEDYGMEHDAAGASVPWLAPPADDEVCRLPETGVEDHGEDDGGHWFIPAASFEGARPGWAFKTSSIGTGYYREVGKAIILLEPYLPSSCRAPGPVRTIALAEAIPAAVVGGGHCADAHARAAEASRRVQVLLGHRVRRAPRNVQRHRKKRSKRARPPPSWHFEVADEWKSKAHSGHRGLGLWALDTANANCWATARQYAESSAADLLFLQETKTRKGQETATAEDQAARIGWDMAIEPCATLDSGYLSAGAAVAARRHFGMANLPNGVHLGGRLTSRVAVKWVGACCRGGLYCISAYLWPAEGMSQRNLDLLEALAWVINALRGPWALAMDGQNTPAQLKATGWLAVVDGIVAAPPEPTCGARTIDYFILSRGLEHSVAAVYCIGDAAFEPHSPVRLLMKAAPRSVKLRRLATPKAVPATLPLACCPRVGSADGIGEDDDDVPAGIAPDARNIDDMYRRWINDAEAVWDSILPADGPRRPGDRALGPRFVWKPAVYKLASPSIFASPSSCRWRCVARWVSDLAVSVAAREVDWRFGDVRREMRLRRRISALVAPRWRDSGADDLFRAWLALNVVQHLDDPRKLEAAAVVAAGRATSAEGKKRTQLETDWRSFVNGGKCGGLARQHRFSRGPRGWIPAKIGHERLHDENDDDDRELGTSVGLSGSAQIVSSAVESPLGAQGITEHEADRWGALWLEGSALPPIQWPQMSGAAPVRLAAAAILDAARSFADDVGLGWDAWHPRALARLPPHLLARLALLLMSVELAGRWPEAIGVTVIVLLRKLDGDFRPIGLMPTIVRLWSRARRMVARRWEGDNARPYFYAGPGCGANVAAWKQGFRAEVADAVEAHYGQLLLDMIKCFEHVALQALIEEAIAVGYPIFVLQLSVASYLLPRSIRIDGVYSRLIVAKRGITAGSVFATTELRVLLIRALDRVVRAVPQAPLTTYVDDLSVEASGTARRVAEALDMAFSVIASLLARLGLVLSPTKNVYTVSTRAAKEQIKEKMDRRRVAFRTRIKSLGIGLGAGKRRNVEVAWQRLRSFRQRGRRFLSLKRAGVDCVRLMRTGGTAGMTYGQSVMGVADNLLLQQRRAVVAAISDGAAGKDLDLTLVLADGGKCRAAVDPAFAAHAEPLCTWTEAVWCNWAQRSAMDRAVAAARLRLTRARRPWAVVRGPAAAAVATAARLGWDLKDAVTVVMHDGNILRLDKEAPKAVLARVREAVARWRWMRIENSYPHLDHGGAGRGIHIDPVVKLASRDIPDEGWGRAQRAALRSAFSRGQWPQVRLARAGLATSTTCKFCEARRADDWQSGETSAPSPTALNTGHSDVGPPGAVGDRDVTGDEFHRIYLCGVTWGIVQQHLRAARAWDVLRGLSDVRRQAQQAAAASPGGRPANVLAWTRALVPFAVEGIDAPSKDGSWHWDVRPDSLPVDGVSYPDASMVDGPGLLVGRLGWAFAVIQRDPFRIIASAYGTVPDWIRSMPAAEGWALLMSSTVLMPSSEYVTDCLEVARSIRKGSAWSTAPARTQARLYGMIMATFDSAEDRDKVDWMPSHLTDGTMSQRRKLSGQLVTAVDVMANRRADTLAKKGAALHRVSEAARRELAEAEAAAHWIARSVGMATWAANNGEADPRRDAEPDQGWKRRRQRQQRKRPLPPPRVARPVALGGHRLRKTAEGWRCETCLTKSVHWHRIARGKCGGAAADRWAARARRLAEVGGLANMGGTDGAGHIRYLSDGTTWCDKCGAYADSFSVGLSRICPGRPTCAGKEQQLRRLRRGRHPVTDIPFVDQPIPELSPSTPRAPRPPPPERRISWGSIGTMAPIAVGDMQRRRPEHEHDPSSTSWPSARQRVDAVRERIRARIAATAAPDTARTGVVPPPNVGTSARRRITGKRPPVTAAVLDGDSGTGTVGAIPSAADDVAMTVSFGSDSSFKRNRGSLCGDTGGPPPGRGKRRRAADLSQSGDTSYVGEPSSGREDGPVNEAVPMFQSRRSLLAALAAASDGACVSRRGVARPRSPSARGLAESDCFVEDDHDDTGGGSRASDLSRGAEVRSVRARHDDASTRQSHLTRGGGADASHGADARPNQRDTDVHSPARPCATACSVTDRGMDAWRSARQCSTATVGPQPGQRGGGSRQPAGQAVPEAARSVRFTAPPGQQPSTRQQLIHALSGNG